MQYRFLVGEWFERFFSALEWNVLEVVTIGYSSEWTKYCDSLRVYYQLNEIELYGPEAC